MTASTFTLLRVAPLLGRVFGPEDEFFNRFAAMARISPFLPLIGGGALAGDAADRAAPAAEAGEPFAAPPEMWRSGDPADTLYQTA
ncbi:MAG: hypothetical protein KY393_06520, partial [Actinobacteria bacterium]|nr:hypothetical protein [Actinomycetota bacterium]